MRVLLAIALVAAAGSTAAAKPSAVAPGDALHDAIVHARAARVQALLDPPVRYASLSFDDDACTKAFGASGAVTKKQLAKFAACLTRLGLDDDFAIVVDRDGDDTVSDQDSPVSRLHVWTGTGARHGIVRVELFRVDDGIEGTTNAGVPGGVDEGVVVAPPPPPPPPPPPAPLIIPPQAIRALRIRGVDKVGPDDATIAAMKKDGKAKVIVPVKLCFDAAGAPTSALVLKSSGYPAYDDAIRAALLGWTIKPYRVDGAAKAVCTAITFIYSPP